MAEKHAIANVFQKMNQRSLSENVFSHTISNTIMRFQFHNDHFSLRKNLAEVS